MRKLGVPAAIVVVAAAAALAFFAGYGRAWLFAGVPSAETGIYREWETFTASDGLPDSWVFSVRAAGDTIWAGTRNGCASFSPKDGKFTAYGTKDGLAHQAVFGIDVDRRGNVWFATGGGASRFDGKRWTTYTRQNSGLVNNVVYGVCCLGDEVWFATTDGLGRLDQKTGEWKKYRMDNAPLEEVWIYGVSSGSGKVWVGAWGGGLVEFDPAAGRWQAYHDPDGAFDVDLVRNDGVISMMTIGTSHADGLTWVGTYFGVSVYDQRAWRDWDENHGLPSNFLNSVKARASTGWCCTDKGLCAVDLAKKRTVTYQNRSDSQSSPCLVTVKDFDGRTLGRYLSRTAIPHNFVWQVDFQGDDVWVATSRGLGRGTLGRGGAR